MLQNFFSKIRAGRRWEHLIILQEAAVMQLHILKPKAFITVLFMVFSVGCASRNAAALSEQAGIFASGESIERLPKKYDDLSVYIVRIKGENDQAVKSLFSASQGECEKMIPRTGRCFYIYRGRHPVYAQMHKDYLEISIQ